MPRPSIGDQELALLHYLAEHEPASVGEVAAGFGEARGLARSTVLTMMERLRAKGYLKRRQAQGVYRYSTATGPGEAMRRAVGQFVENTLSGSVSPFVAWMAERGQVSDAELAELQALVAKLQSGRRER
ncbi:BlaI/MecI/CopY family transcriptional regulator [Fulvimonas soli]|jgi:predicted transcriptional regulator|uniref:Putative transcriptional regulator n=1 Tax=Fulvimonas soli TaxID=155197 RepID=A0A316IID5_9GAMM|nr:BlaI/MecI/CopY family transcriptional regulator [Fulvimonas soli]PWK92274.1 putative transcriptional regulator [Fulvimonas soli]TNY26662.1 methicillin resistance protein [Fulvimonas soli]